MVETLKYVLMHIPALRMDRDPSTGFMLFELLP